MPQRALNLQAWVWHCLGENTFISPLAGDASFRRYFRAKRGEQTWVIMDAPPLQEDIVPFIKVSKVLSQIGINVPKILASDLEKGFLLLSDLGDTVYLDLLNDETAPALYSDAFSVLERFSVITSEHIELVNFENTYMHIELSYFKEWFLGRYLEIELPIGDKVMLERSLETLVLHCESQPKKFVHRDFHSRNLMVQNDRANNPGVIDFQDAVFGPITYDLVSLLKDCYIAWSREKVIEWAKLYWSNNVPKIHNTPVSFEQFLYWFDGMGLQRHLKVLGIFARLYTRDQKDRYLADMPRIVNYITAVSKEYADFTWLGSWMETVIQPILLEKQSNPCAQ